jgi:hypothetical protein
MQLDFLFGVGSVGRESVPDDPKAIVLHFTSGEFSAEIWTDAEGIVGPRRLPAIIDARLP